jgi:hypothetical protein
MAALRLHSGEWRRPDVLVPGQMVDQWGNVKFKFTSKLLQLRVLVGLE